MQTRFSRWCSFALIAMFASVAFALPAIAAADPVFGFQQALYAEAPQAEAHLGQSVAISGDTIVVGEPDHIASLPGVVPTKVGAAYVYVRSNGQWTLQAKLLPPVPWHADDQFGAAVAIDGDVIVVGAPKYYTGGPAAAPKSTGAAFVYRRVAGVWGDPHTITGDAVAEFAQFGAAVAINGNAIAVGAPRDVVGGHSAGTVSTFDWSGADWGAEMKLSDPSPVDGDSFGGSVALEGTYMFAGSTLDSAPGIAPVMSAGSVHVFRHYEIGSGWAHLQTLYAPVPTAAEQFGGPVVASGGRMLASAWQATVGGHLGVGTVYAYAETGPVGSPWVYESTLSAPIAEENGYYGSGLGLDGDTAVVGAFFSNSYNGRAFFWSRSSGSWALTQEVNMLGYHPAVVQLGTSAAVSGDTAVFGGQMSSAPAVPGVGAGGAYVFRSPATFWGMVTNADTGLPVQGIEVSVYTPDAWGDPELARMGFSDPTGLYALSLPAGAYSLGWMDGSNTYYPGFYNEVSLWSESTTVTATSQSSQRIDLAIHPKPLAWLSKLTSPSSVRRLRRFTVYGYLKPRHRARTYPVSLECFQYRRQGDGSYAWVLARTVSARAYDYRPSRRRAWYTKYKATFSLSSRGRWRIRAYHPADGTYAAGYSGWRYITVR